MIYLSSDQHYWHFNVIRYSNRPFDTVEEMNAALVNRWNEVVTDKDDVYVLGDFSLAFRSVELFTSTLKGNKHLVPGNHDHCHSFHQRSRNPENRAKWIRNYEYCGWKVLPEQTTLEIPGLATFNLCHLPYAIDFYDENGNDKYHKWRLKDDGRWLLHGHVHEKTGKIKNQINVGVDVWNGYPCSIEQIEKLMKDPREIINPPYWGKNLLDM